MRIKFLNYIYKIILFTPILLYTGKRSLIAYDEGFYVIQARMILKNNNWVIPTWLDSYTLDRTIGIQYLIAKSQQIFGENLFASHLPSTIAAGLMLFLTFKLHQELIDKKQAIFSALILGTTYIWFNFAHLATQDMIFASLVTSGIYFLIKLNNETKPIYLILFGLWIGLAFMLKTFLIAIPLLSLLPKLFTRRDILLNKYFLIGIFVGFLPFFIWVSSINQYLEKNIILFLIDKFNTLSTENYFTHPFYYYLWNIPINFLPWSIFIFAGLIKNYKNREKIDYVLFYFPIFFIILISLFSTKTPYYTLPIASILSINAFLGIKTLINIKSFKPLFNLLISRITPLCIFCIIFIFFIFFRSSADLSLKEEIFIISGLSLFSLSWLTISKFKKSKYIFISIILGPYLLTSCLIQSGLFTDRSKNIRESMEFIITKEKLNNEIININVERLDDDDSNPKIIRISLHTPKIGRVIKSLEELEPSEITWTIINENSSINDNSYRILFDDKNLYPWKLVKKI